MPLTGKRGAALACPDRARKSNGRGCAHLIGGRGCALDDHPVCEEYLRRDPGWVPGDDPALAGAGRALASAEGARYRSLVADGSWFAAEGWREAAQRLARIGMGLDAPEGEEGRAGPPMAPSAESKEGMVELASTVPERINLSRIGKFRRYPVRKARATRGCAVCSRMIEAGDLYHDGGSEALRAHQACVGESPIEIAMVGPPTLEDVDDLVKAGKRIMLESPTLGCVWLVPERTDPDLNELTFHEWRTLCVMAAHFPGSRFTRVVREGRGGEDSPGGPVEVRCTCHPDARDPGCPVRGQLGEEHPLATRALLECECEQGWTMARVKSECPIGKAFGAHAIPRRKDSDDGPR